VTPEDTKKIVENPGSRTVLGRHTSLLGVEEDIGVRDRRRLQHVFSVGATGTGKTVLMVHAALQDANRGDGFCMVVPKGEAIDQILAKLPEDRLDDVIYIDPSMQEPASINVLEPYITSSMGEAERELQKEIIVSDLIDLFKRQSKNWGDRFGRILTTLLRAHIDLNIQGENHSLMDVFDCITDSDTLTRLINQTDDRVIREQLVRLKEDLSSYELEPLQRRLNDFLENRVTRKIVSVEKSGVNFRDAIQDRKIILVNVQNGRVGKTVSQLVGGIVITQVWAAAQSRITVPEQKRTPFYLYVDEVQNFAGETSNFARILSQAREYGLGCWLVTQYLKQLSPGMRRALTSNCRSKIVFDSSGSEDLSRLAGMIPGINKHRLTCLGDYRAVVHRPRTSPTTVETLPPWTPEEPRNLSELKNRKTREVHTNTVQETETLSLGPGNNAGGEKHLALLEAAKQELEKRGGVEVKQLYQDVKADEPDGTVLLPDGSLANLEAEHTTLTKPGKVLKNLRRGIEQDRKVIFAVEKGNRGKLESILTDPVNRNGTRFKDEHGSYTYYRENGEDLADVEPLREADYHILEVTIEEPKQECPELSEFTREQLRDFCSFRSNGDCTLLNQSCVIQ